MRILFIAPIPPPINGQSKASLVLLDSLAKEHEVEIINLSKTSLKSGANSWKRVFQILLILNEIRIKRKNKDMIFLSLAESFAGNMRDIAIYYLCKNLLNKSFVHMLGGAGMKVILERKNWQTKLNERYLKQLKGIIVEGPINKKMFQSVTNKGNIHIVPNFAEDFLFLQEEEIHNKFKNIDEINLLYLSNLIQGKGYIELAKAYLSLSTLEQSQINITFVGGFEDNQNKVDFLNLIKNNNGLKYLGAFIDGREKRNVYSNSHIFCLPTYYPFEGQPISILEGYATGCVVIASNHSGIPFIFTDQKNGYMVEKGSIESLVKALRKSICEKHNLYQIALFNRNEAMSKYRTDIYTKSIMQLITN